MELDSLKRKNNIELCRVCIMLFIVIHHCIVSGLGLNEILNNGDCTYSSYNAFLVILNSFVIVSVNVFFLISGYFGMKYNLKKVLWLIGEITFYSVFVYFILIGLGG